MDKEQWPRTISTLGRNRRPAVEERKLDLRPFKESMPWPLWSRGCISRYEYQETKNRDTEFPVMKIHW
jgi:hypothetical protein